MALPQAAGQRAQGHILHHTFATGAGEKAWVVQRGERVQRPCILMKSVVTHARARACRSQAAMEDSEVGKESWCLKYVKDVTHSQSLQSEPDRAAKRQRRRQRFG